MPKYKILIEGPDGPVPAGTKFFGEDVQVGDDFYLTYASGAVYSLRVARRRHVDKPSPRTAPRLSTTVVLHCTKLGTVTEG